MIENSRAVVMYKVSFKKRYFKYQVCVQGYMRIMYTKKTKPRSMIVCYVIMCRHTIIQLVVQDISL